METKEHKTTTNQPLCVADVIARFSNEHGWISYSEFNKWMIGRGFDVTERERHNRLYRKNNALRISERAKKFYASHRESIKAKSMAYYRAHREARMAQMREYNKIKI